jgi:hypothetical protein
MYRSAFAVKDLAQWFFQGIVQFWAYSKGNKINITQDVGPVLKKSITWVLPCFQRLRKIFQFIISKNLFSSHANSRTNLGSAPHRGTDFVSIAANVINIMDFVYVCASVMKGVNKYRGVRKELTIDTVWRTLYKVKNAALGFSQILSLQSPIPPTANLVIDTLNTGFYIGKIIASKAWVVDSALSAQLECHSIGVKSFYKSQSSHSLANALLV